MNRLCVCRQLEKDLEEEHQREVNRLREREADREKLRQQQMEENARRQKQEIEQSSASEEEKAKLLREHNKNIEKLESNSQNDRERHRAALQAKLEARKKQRMGAEVAKLDKQSQLEADEEMRNEMAQRQQEMTLQSGFTSLQGSTATDPVPDSGLESTGNREQDWVNLLMASPLFKQINDLEAMLDKSSSTGSGPATSDKILGRL